MDLITKNDKIYLTFLREIEEIDNTVSGVFRDYRPALNGERYLTDKELSERLRISRRTLQDYRTEGRIPYCLIGGKILYKESDMEKWLTENYHSAKPEDF
jgi:excisionase family DNA binding protein